MNIVIKIVTRRSMLVNYVYVPVCVYYNNRYRYTKKSKKGTYQITRKFSMQMHNSK